MKMIDRKIYDHLRKNKQIRELKIKNLEFAIDQTEEMIRESNLKSTELTFLRKKMANSKQELEVLYLISKEQDG